jgi:hypothetical protein
MVKNKLTHKSSFNYPYFQQQNQTQKINLGTIGVLVFGKILHPSKS